MEEVMKIYAPQDPASRAKRALSVVVLLAVAVVVGPQAFANDSADDAQTQHVQADTYTVASGETLWDIAKSMTAPGVDVSETVDAIQKLNVMQSSQLRAGEQILLPSLD
jgi:Tfp pilus assembly protein FimV